MKKAVFIFLCSSTLLFSQNKNIELNPKKSNSNDWYTITSLNQEGAFKLLFKANDLAEVLNKKIAIAILDAAGNTILMTAGDGVGPHNLMAAKRKAFTALSTKTSTLQLSRNVAANTDTINLNSLPELLLLGGGVPIIMNNNVIGSIGIAGAGGPEQDNLLAEQTIKIVNN